MTQINTSGLQIVYAPKGRAGEYSPLAANLYLGCQHGCKYCYVPSAISRTMAEFHSGPAPRQNILPKLERDVQKLKSRGERTPVLFSFASDPYQPAEDDLQLMARAIDIFARYDYPLTILSKAGMRSTRHLDRLPHGSSLAASLTFIEDSDSLKWEPQAAPPAERMDALKVAHERGIRTWVSIEPVIDPAQSLRLIEASLPFVDHYKVGTLNHNKAAKALDYRDFGTRAIEILLAAGKSYYIKRDLEAFLT